MEKLEKKLIFTALTISEELFRAVLQGVILQGVIILGGQLSGDGQFPGGFFFIAEVNLWKVDFLGQIVPGGNLPVENLGTARQFCGGEGNLLDTMSLVLL